MKLRIAQIFLTVVVLGTLAGCTKHAVELPGPTGPAAEKGLFALGFQEAQTLRYKFVSSRDIEVNWGITKGASGRTKNKVETYKESIEMLVAYTPIEVDPDGASATLKATCESVKVRRNKGSNKDAVRSLAGKSFTFTVDAAGKIEDYSQLEQLIKKAGEKAFVPSKKKARTKELDTIGDFTATQWFLWDPVSSIKNPIKGVDVGESWTSQLSVPTPMVTSAPRDVSYTLKEVRETDKGRVAVIDSAYSKAESLTRKWPLPYSGGFQMIGTYGFFRNYKVLELRGKGQELFNMDAGRTDSYNQRYKVTFKADMPLPLPGANPRIIIKQKLTMQLLGKRKR
ncbi:MAG: DUF6263 family protein [Planctomycetota bacterium]|jgi:hypothetical protein